jgi:hypothetical protein
MHVVLLLLLGVLASIGLLTLVAIAAVLRFGDETLQDLRKW